MARSEIADIIEITHQELKQIFAGGVIVRSQVERSFVTQSGHSLLNKGFAQNFLNANS